MNKSINIEVKDTKKPITTNLLDLSLVFAGVILVDSNKLSSLFRLNRLKNGFITTDFSE